MSAHDRGTPRHGVDGIRVAYLDDAPHLAWDGRVHAANATFHRFAARLLDVRDPDGRAPIASLVACVPVRAAGTAPARLPLDPRIRVVATAPFDGIAGFVRHAPAILARNLRPLRSAIAASDVVLLRLPASNGPLAAAVAGMLRVPRVGYVAGSVRAVVAAQARHGPAGAGARLLAAAYDGGTRLATLGAPVVVVGEHLAAGGVVASLVMDAEIRDPGADRAWLADPGALRIAWSGRLVTGKGIEGLLEAVARLRARPPGGRAVSLLLLGEGPASDVLRARATELGLGEAVTFAGYVATRRDYMAALGTADLFVHPSPAEGFPKVVLDAMAVGLPVLATPAGLLAGIAAPPGRAPTAERPIEAVAGTPSAIEDAIRALVAAPDRAAALVAAGTSFARSHTAQAEAGRLAEILRAAAARRAS